MSSSELTSVNMTLKSSLLGTRYSLLVMTYLQKHALYPPQIEQVPQPDLGIIVVIPCHDEPDVVASVQALRDCDAPECAVEVIVVVNDSETSAVEVKRQNELTVRELEAWISEHTDDRFQCFVLHHPDMSKKHAGVGLARKIGMDEAIRRFEAVGNPQGVMACFDADSACDANYLQAIEQHFDSHDTVACSIYFEHPTSGETYPAEVYDAIVEYELYLRYYVHALRFSGFPYAYQTIGSSMAVRADAYQKQGGMNRRKAGEDFYFLHKFIPHGHFSELIATRVIPSPRPSHRVPFGTGKAVGDIIDAGAKYLAYHPHVFIDLQFFIQKINLLYYKNNKTDIARFIDELPHSIREFLLINNFQKKIHEIHAHTANEVTFRQRFFQWFNAFMVLKYVHHARDAYYASVPVWEAAMWLLEKREISIEEDATARDLLSIFRKMDKVIR